MNDFDKAARYAGRYLDGEGTLRWLLGEPFWAAWGWARWLDTQALAFPGEPDRRMDVVAEFARRAHDAPPLAVVVEFMSEPRSDTLERLADYCLQLRRDLPYQTAPLVKYDVIAVLVNLTGTGQGEEWAMRPPDCDGLGQTLKARVCNLAEKNATPILAGMAAGTLLRALLPWVPLMAGGGEATTLAEWRRLAEAEPDERRRGDYGALALIFANLAGKLDVWKPGLEGWNVERSQVTLEWEARGEARGRVEGQLETARSKLLRALQVRFGANLPAEVVTAVEGQADQAALDRWFDLALTATTLDEVRVGFGLNGA